MLNLFPEQARQHRREVYEAAVIVLRLARLEPDRSRGEVHLGQGQGQDFVLDAPPERVRDRRDHLEVVWQPPADAPYWSRSKKPLRRSDSLSCRMIGSRCSLPFS